MARFDTVLVANRGEIAVRLIMAVRAAGLRSVAVYSDADRGASHVRLADTAVRIGPARAQESYLSVDALLDAAKQTGCGAVHPGYGFLSERAEFARAVTGAGLVFIGPPAEVMEAMGRKNRARALAVAAGVPVVPAASPESAAAEDLDDIARQVGFPLMVKAVAGGGGKGMRIVTDRADLDQSVASARREALAAFGDGALLYERYVEHGRHIEVQIMADEHGQVVHLYDRDCSVQRRHQKVVEEAPASTIGSATRELLASSAVALARSVGYVGAGTVEFLVAGEDAYFLEMNTRLQVEHPVTEWVTGLDLVAMQLAVAQGEPLSINQQDIAVTGHAIEARVYAEDAAHGFLPQAGTAELVHWPRGVRVDAALEDGQEVTTDYDPLLGKVIASGSTREAARQALVHALDDTAILGLTTNAGFLRRLVDSAAFRVAGIDTGWLDREALTGHAALGAPDVPDQAWCLAAWALGVPQVSDLADPFDYADGWRLGAPPAAVPVTLLTEDRSASDETAGGRELSIDPSAGTVSATAVGGPAGSAVTWRAGVLGLGWDGQRLQLEIDGVVESGYVVVRRHDVQVAYQGQTFVFERPDAFSSTHHAEPGDGTVLAPMPGTVLSVEVAVGDEVARGSTLGVVEAMKMELALKAPVDGIVTEVHAVGGQQVGLGEALFVVTVESPSP